MATVVTHSSLGFGGYVLPEGSSFEGLQTSLKAAKIFSALFFLASSAVSLSIIPVFWPVGLAASAILLYRAVQAILEAVGIFYRARPMQHLFPNEIERSLPPLGVLTDQLHSGFATRDGPESHEWKLNLIRAARQTIFLSGCYCGGKAFDEALDLMQERMQLLPELHVSILSSELFVTRENSERLEAMKHRFQDRFTCVTTPEVFPYYSLAKETASLTTHHTKALVIDYGSAFMAGGSGMLSTWSEQKGEQEAYQVESHGLFYDYFLTMKGFRDMDFVFHSPELNGIGARLYVEMTKLFARFQTGTPKLPPTTWPARLEPLDLPQTAGDLKLACYASGPDEAGGGFLEEIVQQVEDAKESILIGHLYFHPPPKLLQALINASNRGVSITLLTNQLQDRSPGSHLGHAELSRYYAKSLYEGKEKPNVRIFEYCIPYTSYHKKAMVFDRKTILLGSSNIGLKSFENDYEINFKVKSETFASSVTALIEADKAFCEEDSTPAISLKTRVLSTLQSLLTPFL